jgi:predicted esterase
MNPIPGFIHRFVPGSSNRTLLLLHGTGGSETDLLSLGHTLDPKAALLSPRGRVLENGMPRFFRRLAEGIFDEDDLIRRANELADFIVCAAGQYTFDASKVIAVGYSNGANIGGAVLLLRPHVLEAAALIRPMVPLTPKDAPDLQGKAVLIAAGNQDPIVPLENSRALATLLHRAGADVTLRIENGGHTFTETTVDTIRHWLGKVSL